MRRFAVGLAQGRIRLRAFHPRLNPNYAPAHLWNAGFRLTPGGRLEDSVLEGARCVELEPLVPIHYAGSILVAVFQRQYDLAQAVARKVLELEPDFGLGLCFLAEVLCQEGACEEAVATMQHACRILASGGFWGPGLLGYCCARRGRQEEARRVLADLETLRERSCAQAIALAAVHAGLDEKDRALDWLERAGTVMHHVEGAWFPNWIGAMQVRNYEFTENRLTLRADLPAGPSILVWERI